MPSVKLELVLLYGGPCHQPTEFPIATLGTATRYPEASGDCVTAHRDLIREPQYSRGRPGCQTAKRVV